MIYFAKKYLKPKCWK